MIKNYLLIALRNIVRHKLYSFINIIGLAVGLACVILIILFLRDELSYDKWVPDAENLYRIEMTFQVPDRPPLAMAMMPFPMPQAMRDEIPSVTGMTRVWQNGMTLTDGNRQFLENVDSVDPGFFKLIHLPLVAGDADTVFRQPQSLVLSKSAARKYFGDVNPLGHVLLTARAGCPDTDLDCQKQTVALRVTGVMRDLPHNTHLAGDVFIPNTSIADNTTQATKQSWITQAGWGYVRLAPGTDPNAVIAQMGPMLDRAVTPELKKLGIAARGSQAYRIRLTPFTQVHLDSSNLQFNMTPPGSWATVYGVAVIGLMILLIACFNFTNLSTARAMLRAHEIGLRKTVGARKSQLVVQFLGEAVLMALLALVLALALAEVALPVLDTFLQRPIAFHYTTDRTLLFLMVAISIGAGLISGIYPALVLSGFSPASALRAKNAGHGGSGFMRNLLVVLQFAVSVGLGIAALVVFSQINYARDIELGFRYNDVLFVGASNLSSEQRQAMAQALRDTPGVIDVSASSKMPFQTGQALLQAQIPGQSDTFSLNRIAITPDYPKVFGMKLIAGRLLSETRSDDRIHNVAPGSDPLNEGRNIIINAAAARLMAFRPEQAVGRVILFNHSHVRIVGVLADAKVRGAREPVKPTAYAYVPDYPMDFAIHLRPDNVPSTLAFIDHTWHAFSPTVAIQRIFLRDVFEQFYRPDERQGKVFAIFVAIAIFIACLGLFGLAAFTAGRRTREIGIRKVFGARTRDLVFLLLLQFSIPVLIANAVAWPVAWYYLHGWLQTFAYHISLSPLYFLGAGAVAMLIAWVTVYTHARKVAGANPIYALRYE